MLLEVLFFQLVSFLPPLFLVLGLVFQEFIQISLVFNHFFLFSCQLGCESAAFGFFDFFLFSHCLQFLLFPLKVSVDSLLEILYINFLLVHSCVVLLWNEHVGPVLVVILLDQFIIGLPKILFVLWVRRLVLLLLALVIRGAVGALGGSGALTGLLDAGNLLDFALRREGGLVLGLVIAVKVLRLHRLLVTLPQLLRFLLRAHYYVLVDVPEVFVANV